MAGTQLKGVSDDCSSVFNNFLPLDGQKNVPCVSLHSDEFSILKCVGYMSVLDVSFLSYCKLFRELGYTILSYFLFPLINIFFSFLMMLSLEKTRGVDRMCLWSKILISFLCPSGLWNVDTNILFLFFCYLSCLQNSLSTMCFSYSGPRFCFLFFFKLSS